MNFMPLFRMWERVERSKDDSDSDFFRTLLLAGEFLTKLVTIGLIATIQDDKERHRYRFSHIVVRSNGIGEWARTINEILIGPASQYILEEARKETLELNKKVSSESWQYESIQLLDKSIRYVHPDLENLSSKVKGSQWFHHFALLRNKTRGHGAELSSIRSKIAPDLERSILLWIENYTLFQRSWAYLHQNLSQKYRVTRISQDTTVFSHLTSQKLSVKYPDGVYVYYDGIIPVYLLKSDVDATDFWVPNGNFEKGYYEEISYISGDVRKVDGKEFIAPIQLPKSETHGLEELDVIGETFSNLPQKPNDYISRPNLEDELMRVLSSQTRYPIVTLVGRGGIGKTYLALKVLHELSEREVFDTILWFSARDLDLTIRGPKSVQPRILTNKEIAAEFFELFSHLLEDNHVKKPNVLEYMQNSLHSGYSPTGDRPMLLVFDNFETIADPLEVFRWLDSFIEPPNKILITTRHREFKGDYPVSVSGMERSEFDELVKQTAIKLNISDILKPQYVDSLFEESEGHPYVVKILLGEVATSRRATKTERILASREDILRALFERTFTNLSSAAQRIFLTLGSWRSLVPVVALEAVLLNSLHERISIQDAVDELVRYSFIEVVTSKDEDEFIRVPEVARIFSQRKLRTSPLQSSIKADLELLRAFGPTNETNVVQGMKPRINRLIKFIDEQVSGDKEPLENYIKILEFVATKYPDTWLRIADLYRKHRPDNWLNLAIGATQRYLEYNPENRTAWYSLIELYKRIGDDHAQINAIVSMCQTPSIPYSVLSNSANTINNIIREAAQSGAPLETNEKQVVVRQLAVLMEERIDEADATDCSRLAWLFLQLKDEEKAMRIAEKGLSIEPENQHCQKLTIRLGKK